MLSHLVLPLINRPIDQLIRTISSASTPLIRYALPPLMTAVGLALVFYAHTPVSGSLLLAFGLFSFFSVRRFCTVVLISDGILVRRGFTEIRIEYADVVSVVWSGSHDLVKIMTKEPTALGQTIWFRAKARCWVAKPHPIVAELQQLCGLVEIGSLGIDD